jgi:hypothetical protein
MHLSVHGDLVSKVRVRTVETESETRGQRERDKETIGEEALAMEIVRTAGNRQNIPGRRRESGSTMREPRKERDRVSFVYMRREERSTPS